MWHGYMGWPSAAPLLKVIKYICTGSDKVPEGSRQLYICNMLTMHCVSGIYGVQNICTSGLGSLGTCMCWAVLSAHGMDYIRTVKNHQKTFSFINPFACSNDSRFFLNLF